MGCKYCDCENCARERRVDEPDEQARRIREIFRLAAGSGAIPRAEVLNFTRTGRATIARQTAMYLVRRLTNLGYVRIGAIFNRDHSTVIHAVQVIERRMEYPAFKKLIDGWAAQIEDAKCPIVNEAPPFSAYPTQHCVLKHGHYGDHEWRAVEKREDAA
jgi:hypothetical protein